MEIEAIRRVLRSGARIEAHPYLKCGNRVRIKCGALAGIEGILVRKKNISRLVLSVEMLGTSAAMEVAASEVEAVNPPQGRASHIGDRGGSPHTRTSDVVAQV